jgi:dTDP-glucose 4,6-dehydratase
LGETYLLGSENQRSNLQVVRAILAAMGRQEDFIDFIADRPGHDRRYAIDASKAIKKLGWTPREDSFEQKLPEVIEFYSRLEINLDSISHSGLSNKSKKSINF